MIVLVTLASEMNNQSYSKREEVLSMLLGLGIIILVTFLLVRYFRKYLAGKIDLPGVSDTVLIATVTPSQQANKEPAVIKDQEYQVVRGDSLSKIAKKAYGRGDKWVLIAKDNQIGNPNRLMVGQKLKLQKLKTVIPEVSITSGEYKIRRGDTLAKIALRAYGDSYSWVKIWKANKYISNPNIIHVDNVLVIPRS